MLKEFAFIFHFSLFLIISLSIIHQDLTLYSAGTLKTGGILKNILSTPGTYLLLSRCWCPQ